VLPLVESLVDDLEKEQPPKVESAPPAAAKGKGKGAVAAPPTEVVTEPPSLVMSAWKQEVQTMTAVSGAVTTAHRAIITERNESVIMYVERFRSAVESIREMYGTIIAHENSWKERWRRQVEMLKSGDF